MTRAEAERACGGSSRPISNVRPNRPRSGHAPSTRSPASCASASRSRARAFRIARTASRCSGSTSRRRSASGRWRRSSRRTLSDWRARMLDQGLVPEDRPQRDDVPVLDLRAGGQEGAGLSADPAPDAARPRRRRQGDADPDLQFLRLPKLDAVIDAIPDHMVDKDVLGPVLRLVILAAATRGCVSRNCSGCAGGTSTAGPAHSRPQRLGAPRALGRGQVRSLDVALGADDRPLTGELKKWSLRTLRSRERSGLRTPPARRAVGPHQGHRASSRPAPTPPAADPLSRSAPHVRDHARGPRRPVAHDPGIARPRGLPDDADLHPLRAIRARSAGDQ